MGPIIMVQWRMGVFWQDGYLSNTAIFPREPQHIPRHTPGIQIPPDESNSFINCWFGSWGMFTSEPSMNFQSKFLLVFWGSSIFHWTMGKTQQRSTPSSGLLLSNHRQWMHWQSTPTGFGGAWLQMETCQGSLGMERVEQWTKGPWLFRLYRGWSPTQLHPWKPTWHWNIPIFNRKYIHLQMVDFPLSC